MRLLALLLHIALAAFPAVAHHDDAMQMPLDYVKYPYQGAYGKDIGMSLSYNRSS